MRHGHGRTGIVLAVASAGVAATVAVAAFLLRDTPIADPLPVDETAALVQSWMRQSTPSAHVEACTNTQVTDTQVGGRIFACRLWYVAPERYATLCVVVEDHVVRRKIGAGDPSQPPRVRCEGVSSTDPVFDGSF